MATIRKKGDFQWHCQVRRKGYPNQTRTFNTKGEAEKWARDIEGEMDRGLFQDRREADKNTLAQVLCRFRDEVVPSHKGRDAETIRINALLKDRITSYKMSALSGSALSDFILRRQKLVSSATVRREIDIISSAVTKARKAWGIHLPENPVALIERPRPAKARERRLNGDEEARLMQALEDHADAHEDSKQYRKGSRNPWIKPFVQLAIHTAMRRGELLSLRWEDISLEERTAHLLDTKNGDARTVPLSSLAAATLRQLPQDPSGQVFPITADAVKKGFERARNRARADYVSECERNGTVPDDRLLDLRLHDLRHEATSRIAGKLDNILELSAVTGHKDIRMLKRYYHPRASDLALKLD